VFGRIPEGADDEIVFELPVDPEAPFEFPVPPPPFPVELIVALVLLLLAWLVVAGLFAVVVTGAEATVVEDARLFTAILNPCVIIVP
jgi:hypothetical protein